ncbi:MAG: hypothetical protein QXP60_03165 [Nitrososphaerota archaeon]
MSKEEEYERLKDFLNKFGEDLNYGIKVIIPGIIEMKMLPLDLRVSIENSWREIEEIFNKVLDGIDNIKISDLEKVGLSGAELDFKISIFNSLHYNFRKMLSQEAFKKLLKAADSILEGLSLNIFLVHRIIGFKESIELLLL